jgi:predicted transposase/invertase (TIGR01784 family)
MRIVINNFFRDPEYLGRFYREFSQRDVASDRIKVITLNERESYKTKVSNDLGLYVRHEDDEDELIVLVEAQSTWNPNMPYRFLEYIMATWGNYVTDHKFSKYRAPQFYLPPSRCCLIYTGDEEAKPDGTMNFTRMYHPKITRIPEYVHFDVRVLSAKENNTIAGQYIWFSKLAAVLRTKCKNGVEFIETFKRACLDEGYDVMAQFIEKYERKMEDAMELSITSNEIFDNFLQGKCNDAAEKGRKEGEKIGEARGVKIGEERGKISAVLDLYIAGFIARDVASAQLGVTDQEFETLLQSRS